MRPSIDKSRWLLSFMRVPYNGIIGLFQSSDEGSTPSIRSRSVWKRIVTRTWWNRRGRQPYVRIRPGRWSPASLQNLCSSGFDSCRPCNGVFCRVTNCKVGSTPIYSTVLWDSLMAQNVRSWDTYRKMKVQILPTQQSRSDVTLFSLEKKRYWFESSRSSNGILWTNGKSLKNGVQIIIYFIYC